MEVPYTNIQLEAEKSLAISVDADSAYGDAVRLTNTTGEKTDVSLKSPEVSIQGNIIGSMTFSVGNHTLKPESIC